MKILLLTDSYPPEIRSASHLMLELAEGLRNRGFDVYVATSYPRYNLTQEQKDREYEEFEEEKGIKVIRVKTLPHHKVNFIVRGISQLSMPYIFENKIKKYIKKIDVIIVYSPPLPLATLGGKLKKYYSAKFILNVQDIFPQNAIDLGVLKNPILIRLFKNIERKAYQTADLIFVHSEGNLEFVKKAYPDFKNKFTVLHNWIDVNEFDGVKRTGYFRKLYGLEDKFIILFAGVIGPSQGLDFVLDVAKNVEELENLVFLFVGDGMERKKLEEITKTQNIKNVIFKDFVSKEKYPELVKDSDVGLVSLTNKNKTPVVPGKILGYMAAGIPILAFLNKESDGHFIIKDAECGFSCEYGNFQKATELVKKMFYSSELKKLGTNGKKYVLKNFNKEKILDMLIKKFQSEGV